MGGGQPLGHLVGDAQRLGDGELRRRARRRSSSDSPLSNGMARKGTPLSSPTWKMATMCGCSMAAAARASRRKRSLFCGFCGDGRQHRLQGDLAAELRVLGEEDHAHAAGAELLQDAVRPEPADLVGLLGGAEEGEGIFGLGVRPGRPGRRMIRAEAGRRLALVRGSGNENQPGGRPFRLGFVPGGGCGHSLQTGYEVRDRLRFRHQPGGGSGANGLDERVVRRHRVHRRLTDLAFGEVAFHLPGDVGGQLPQEETSEILRVGAGRARVMANSRGDRGRGLT